MRKKGGNLVKQEERDNHNNETALFRYGLIAPIINGTYNEKSESEYYSKVAAMPHKFNGKEQAISPSTIKYWTYKYRKEGYDGLKPKTRSDFNTSRKLNDETKKRIVEIKEKHLHISNSLIYNKLIEEDLITKETVSYSTVSKFIRDNCVLFESDVVDRRAFVMPYANDCWQADTTHGPYLTIINKKKRAYLIAIIDDASRLIVHAQFYFEDNAINFQEVYKKAIKKYGKPKKLFVDNGTPYKNKQLNIISASLGNILIHARPYSGASKGKIERFFRTMKSSWMRGLDWDKIKDLNELNEMLFEFINDYNSKEHSSLDGKSPKQRFIEDLGLINKMDNELIDSYFLHTFYPTIRSDSIARINGVEYEVDTKYIKQKIVVKLNPKDALVAWIYEDDEPVCEIKPVNKIDNSSIKRKKTIY